MSFDLTQLEAVTDDYWIKTPVDIHFTDSVLLYKLMAGGKMLENLVTGSDLVDGGKKIRQILEYTFSNRSTYGNTTTIPLAKKSIYNAALFGWAGYIGSAVMDLDDQIQNNGAAAMVDLAFGLLQNMSKSIRDLMGTGVYGSALVDDKNFAGFSDIFNTSTSTKYGGIAEDDMADWKANLIATAEAISFKVLQTIRRTASVGQNKGDKPDLYITTEVLKDGYERTLQVQARYSDVSLVNAGFDNVLFGGAPVVPDDKQTAGYLDALNLKYLTIKTHSKYNFTKPKWEHPIDQPDTLVANTRWVGQLLCSNRKSACRHTNLSEPT
ncbi:MAG TPA: phage major capsid protein [Syntrophobacteraceae bacterium]|nr:phage major capsid protein [Syntrophobacteraceae bacterium]